MFKPQRGFVQPFEWLRRNPVGVEIPNKSHRVARAAQPYAGGRNAVGVEIKRHAASHQFESHTKRIDSTGFQPLIAVRRIATFSPKLAKNLRLPKTCRHLIRIAARRSIGLAAVPPKRPLSPFPESTRDFIFAIGPTCDGFA